MFLHTHTHTHTHNHTYPILVIAMRISGLRPASSHLRTGFNGRPFLILISKSSRRIFQSRSCMSSSSLSLQWRPFIACSRAAYAASLRISLRRFFSCASWCSCSNALRSSELPALSMSLWCRRFVSDSMKPPFCFRCSRLSTPPMYPRPNSTLFCARRLYSGLWSVEVSSVSSWEKRGEKLALELSRIAHLKEID